MMVNMAHMQYHLGALQIEFSCKIFQSALHLNWVIMLTNKSGRLVPIDLFHNDFSPSGMQPEHHKLAHEL